MKTRQKYAIFRTQWGYFGLVGTERGLLRSSLPCRGRVGAEVVKDYLLRGLAGVEEDRRFYKGLQGRLIAYFEGERVEFGRDVPVDLAGRSEFERRVLEACRGIGYGKRVSYLQLAKRLGRARAARAVGNTLAKNPLPLIIPCHRVIRSDGGIGGFSTMGGVEMKKKMLEFEQQRWI